MSSAYGDVKLSPAATDLSAYKQMMRRAISEGLFEARPVHTPMDAAIVGWNAAKKSASYQSRVAQWAHQCLPARVLGDRVVRGHRFLEEALELVQAAGVSEYNAHMLVGYVFAKAPGRFPDEVGDVCMTLATLATAACCSVDDCAETALDRCWENIDKISAKAHLSDPASPIPYQVALDPAGVGGRRLEGSLADFEAEAQLLIAREQAKHSPDVSVIKALCSAVRLSREFTDTFVTTLGGRS